MQINKAEKTKKITNELSLAMLEFDDVENQQQVLSRKMELQRLERVISFNNDEDTQVKHLMSQIAKGDKTRRAIQ